MSMNYYVHAMTCMIAVFDHGCEPGTVILPLKRRLKKQKLKITSTWPKCVVLLLKFYRLGNIMEF